MSKEPITPAPHVLVVNTGQEGLPLADPTIGARPDDELVEKAMRDFKKAMSQKDI